MRKASSQSVAARARRNRDDEQVAAICYRVAGAGVEFLLVQTRGSRRWTFPKGCIESGMTRAQAAALEALEEAGAHGRMEAVPFARYTSRKRSAEGAAAVTTVHAYLCEVLWQDRPRESKRKPTWLSADKAKVRLRAGRSPEAAAGFARVVERAVARVQRLRRTASAAPDALRKVQFEAGTISGTQVRHAAAARSIPRAGSFPASDAIKAAIGARLSNLLPFAPRQLNGIGRLLTDGSPPPSKKGGSGKTPGAGRKKR